MTTTDPDVVSYLRAALAEVRARAEAAEQDAPSPWVATGGLVDAAGQVANHYHYGDTGLWNNEGSDTLSMSPPVAAHVASFDPATVLRMVAATEMLLELHPAHEVTKFGDAERSVICDHCRSPYPCVALRIEADRWGWTGE